MRASKGTKLFCRVFAIALIIVVPACGFKASRDPDVLVERLPADPATLNPFLASDAVSFDVLTNVYESLMDRDNKTLKFRPKLAVGWKVSPDHLAYTFTLREGVKWHDGKPFTADDVIYSFNKIRDPKVDAALLRSYFSDVVSVSRLDGKTVKFVYKRPYFKALEILGSLPIIPKHVFENESDFNGSPYGQRPIGTGPFVFKSWDTGTAIKLAANPDYWGERPKIKGLVFKIIPSSTTAFQLLKKEGIDVADLNSLEWAKQTEGPSFEEHFQKYKYWPPNYAFIAWNLKKPFFEDKRVRIAMSMSIDRGAILKELLFGLGEMVSGPFYRFGNCYDEGAVPYPFDPQKAGRLLDEAGWIDHDGDGIRDKDGVLFQFTYMTGAGDRFGQNIGLILRENLMRIGIQMDIISLEWAAMIRLLLTRQYDAVSLSRNTPLDEDPYQSWHSSQADFGGNLSGFKNKDADRLLEEGRLEFDAAKRAAIYKKLHRIIHEEEPATFLFTAPALVAISKRFSNINMYKGGFDIFEWDVNPRTKLVEW